MTTRRALAFLTAGLLAACGKSPAAGSDPAPAAPPPAAPAPAAVEPPKAPPDPMKDAAAWKALPAPERASRAAEIVAKTDASSASQVETTRVFLDERAEATAVAALAKAALAKGSMAPWAHQAAGDVDVCAEVNACLAASALCDDAGDAAFVQLKGERAKQGGTWWVNAESAKRVHGLVAEIAETEKLLGTPYGQAIAHWKQWQRAIEVMKESPALSRARGPYLVFVSLATKKPKKGEKPSNDEAAADLKDVPPDEITRGNAILDRTLDLLEHFYDGWITNLGPVFGFTRYTAENTDLGVMLKMNVFKNEEEYERYNAKVGMNSSGFARAYYMPMEPRFITTYEGGADEDADTTRHVQCHEATHQLVHLYTWDLTRRETKRDVTWLDCEVSPLWSNEGFAEFFSSHVVKDGKYLWMQPLVSRLRDLKILGEVVKEKKWEPLSLKEILSLRHSGQLQELAAGRAKKPADMGLATGLIGNIYYAKAWSLVWFLWNADEGGKPKYRDRYVEYLKREFHLRYKMDTMKGKEMPLSITAVDFRQIMGLTAEDKFAAFEKEWLAYETKLVAQHEQPSWKDDRAKLRKMMGLPE